jgi:hypothetical protein
MKWLTDEVFVPEDDEERVEIDEEQYGFEEKLDREIQEASKEYLRRREEGVRIFRSEEDAYEEDAIVDSD